MATDEKLTTRIGDATKTVRFGLRATDDLTGYTCKISVFNLGTDTVTGIDGATITDKVTVGSKEYFAVALTGAQTATLTADQYILYMRISGPSGPFTDEIDLEIKSQVVPD